MSETGTPMTPMMKRLCEAACRGADSCGFNMFEDVQEAVVAAVLTELKNLDEATFEAAGNVWIDRYDQQVHIGGYWAREVTHAAIDHILAQPTEA